MLRIPYSRWLPHKLMRKIRSYRGVLSTLEEFQPEIVYCHGIQGAWLLDVLKFKNKNPNIRLYADNHADANNSATNLISRWVLHRLIYRPIIKLCTPHIEKILCVSTEAMDFVHSEYGVNPELTEFYPLGAHIFSDKDYESRRKSTREKLGISDGKIILLQSGKFDKKKKLDVALYQFMSIQDDHNMVYLIAGQLTSEIDPLILAAAKERSNIRFLGWQSPESLSDLLCSADIYIQPGSQSATMQMSLGARCPVIIADVKAHIPYVKENGWLIKNDHELGHIFNHIAKNPGILSIMAEKSKAIAEKLLDYKKLASRIY